MEDLTFQDIYDGFARQMTRNTQTVTPGQVVAYVALYRNILPQFREQIILKLRELWESNPDELVENMETAIGVYRQFERTFEPA